MDISSLQPEDIVLQKEEFSYGFIIEVLTQGLYPNKFHVLREYVQNAFDAILTWRRTTKDPNHGRIDIKISDPSIFIYDDGTGMDWLKVNQYRYVGYSEKRTGEGVGFRGIGKLSGISVADKLIITTSPYGVAQRYKLVFDADVMLEHMLSLKQRGQNIPLNDLIKEHTFIDIEEEDIDKHYTLVELFNVKKDASILMNEKHLADYLSLNAPVDFDPNFSYGKLIDGWLRKNVQDYDTAPVYLNGKQLYKPFLSDINPPVYGFVWDSENEPVGEAPDTQSGREPIAFYWYCEHSEKGQFSDEIIRGLFYRIKNFTVGTNQLPRITIWKSTPERAFYFFGEIHILDSKVIPTSSRDDFEQNDARERFYSLAVQISRTLNQIAGDSSSHRRAKDFIIEAESIVQNVQSEISSGQIPREVKFKTMFDVQSAILEVSKRKNDAPKGFGERAENVIEAGEKLIKQIENVESNGSITTYDITTQLQLGEEGSQVYKIIVDCLKDEFGEQSDIYVRLVRRIHSALRKKWIL
jgi:hypothetical protein